MQGELCHEYATIHQNVIQIIAIPSPHQSSLPAMAHFKPSLQCRALRLLYPFPRFDLRALCLVQSSSFRHWCNPAPEHSIATCVPPLGIIASLCISSNLFSRRSSFDFVTCSRSVSRSRASMPLEYMVIAGLYLPKVDERVAFLCFLWVE